MKENNERSLHAQAPGAPQEREPLLSRTECNIMRGFAIIIIVINNFTHLFRGVFKDNEYDYVWKNVEGVMANLHHPDSILPFNLLSFYCPYGVMLFIFLSGYGLTLKYEKSMAQRVPCRAFVTDHYNKMFTMQLKGLTIYILLTLLFFKDFVFSGTDTLQQVFLVGNLVPYSSILPGPYWFFGMIMEMYVIYRLCIYRRADWVMWTIVALSLIVMALCRNYLYYLRLNCFVAILPFCLGVFAARHLDSRFARLDRSLSCWGWFAASFVLLTLTKFNFYAWLVMPVFIVATAVTIVKLMCRTNLLLQVFGWLGTLSGVLFVVHPSVRVILIERANASGQYYSILVIYLLVTFGLSIMLQPVFSKKKSKNG